MDRFIAEICSPKKTFDFYLKSNMDRFIVLFHRKGVQCSEHLKSNMDRFIVRLLIHARK